MHDNINIEVSTVSADSSACSLKKASKPVSLSIENESRTIVQLPDGTLMGSYICKTNGISTVVAQFSSDSGITWSSAQMLFDIPGGTGIWVLPEALLDREGEVHLFFLNDAGGGIITAGEAEKPLMGEMLNMRLDIWHAGSKNTRKEWSPLKMLWKGYTGALNSVIQLKSGRILLPFSFLTSRSWQKRGKGLDEFVFHGFYDCTLIYSDDSGNTWHPANNVKVPVPDIVYAYGATEPVLVELRDGRVWMLIRTQMGRFYESFSEDGALWSHPQPTSITSSDSPAGIVRLYDGRIVLFWNNCLRDAYAYGGRQVLHAAISDDEGSTWHGFREAARDPKRNQPPPANGDYGTAYPFPLALNNSKVLFCTGQGEGRVMLMQLDPEWLLETCHKSDFSENKDEWSVFGTKGVEFPPHPDKKNTAILSIKKNEPDWPASAIWNFPSGLQGIMSIKFMLNKGFRGALLGITDHFSPPFDMEDRFKNIFNLEIGPDCCLPNGMLIKPGCWHEFLLKWDCLQRRCIVMLDDEQECILPMRHETSGVCYLRLRSTVGDIDYAGFLIEYVEVNVSPVSGL